MRKSQLSASEKPVWTATPFIAAIVSLSMPRIAVLTGCEILRRPLIVPSTLS